MLSEELTYQGLPKAVDDINAGSRRYNRVQVRYEQPN